MTLESPDGWAVEAPPAGAARGRAGKARGVEGPGHRAGRSAADDPLLSRKAAARRPLRLERGARRRARRALRALAARRRRAPEDRRRARRSRRARSHTASAIRRSAKSGGRCGPCPLLEVARRARSARLARRRPGEAARGHADLQRGAAGRRAGSRSVPPAGWPATAPSPFSLSKAGERTFLDVVLRAPARLRPAARRSASSRSSTDGATADLGIRLIDYGYIRRTPLPERFRGRDRGRGHPLSADPPPRLRPRRRGPRPRGAGGRRCAGRDALGARARNRRPLGATTPSSSEAAPTRPTRSSRARTAGCSTTSATAGCSSSSTSSIRSSRAATRPSRSRSRGPHDRVTDESAAVTVLDPASPVFTTPNRIGPEDWNGWVQERGLYFARSWGPSTRRCSPWPTRAARSRRARCWPRSVGKGRYVYTGLAFFRQLPAGVPGAYRLLANLLAWKS